MEVKFVGWHDPAGPVPELIRKAVNFCALALLEDARDDITVEVFILDDMHLETTGTRLVEDAEDQVMGGVYFDEEVYDTDLKDTFNLGVWYGCDPGELFTIVCHEMVHVAQYVSKRMRTIRAGGMTCNMWEGEFVDVENVDYFDLPWEVEAYDLQEALMNALVEEGAFMDGVKSLAAK